MNLSDIAILNVKGFDYSCIITLISKNEAINLLQNAFLKVYIKIEKTIAKFDDIKIPKKKFGSIKNLFQQKM